MSTCILATFSLEQGWRRPGRYRLFKIGLQPLKLVINLHSFCIFVKGKDIIHSETLYVLRACLVIIKRLVLLHYHLMQNHRQGKQSWSLCIQVSHRCHDLTHLLVYTCTPCLPHKAAVHLCERNTVLQHNWYTWLNYFNCHLKLSINFLTASPNHMPGDISSLLHEKTKRQILESVHREPSRLLTFLKMDWTLSSCTHLGVL